MVDLFFTRVTYFAYFPIETEPERHTLTLCVRLRRIRVEVVDTTDLALEALLRSWDPGHLVDGFNLPL